MIDYRDTKNRREVFLDFYEYHLKNKAHAGAVYYVFPYIFDLLQMNIEGDEYPMLESMLKDGSIDKFKNIQVQFHLGIENDINRHYEICQALEDRGFKSKFSYPFVWESWTKLS
jgi:hypothetical protein